MVRMLSTVLLVLAGVALGCKPEIGDSCRISTDCSTIGDRLCDTSMPGGYCTLFNCTESSCPDEALCVEFHADAERFARRFCVRSCGKADDCREGYVCIDPGKRDGVVIGSSGTVCLP
jgi:hypothetical protein